MLLLLLDNNNGRMRLRWLVLLLLLLLLTLQSARNCFWAEHCCSSGLASIVVLARRETGVRLLLAQRVVQRARSRRRH